MKYCVFCAGWLPCNEVAILQAKKAAENCKLVWELNADVHGIYEGSKLSINEKDGNNISIWFEDGDIDRLIFSCMQFAYERSRLKHINYGKN